MPAVATHHTATSASPWDAGAAEKALGDDYTVAVLRDEYAWVPDGDTPNKNDCVFPHHFVENGKPGAASTVACSAVVGALNGAHGGSDIPSGDRRGVYNHVIAHLKDSGVEEADLPELKSAGRPLARRGLLLPREGDGALGLRERRAAMDEARRGRVERRGTAVAQALAQMNANPDSASGPSFKFEGYAAMFESPFTMWDMWGDEYQEVLAAGSCTRTLNSSPDVPFLIGHNDSGIALARTERPGRPGTMTLSRDTSGLHVYVPALDGRSPLVQALASAMERGDMDEMSFAFVVNQQEWSPDFMQRRILEVDIHRGDVSVVCLAANAATAGASMTAVPVSGALAAGRPAERRADTAPDFSDAPAYDDAAHGDSSLTCPNGDCGLMNANDARYCDQCGQPLYDEGGLIETGGSVDDVVSDSAGMIEEEDMTLAQARLNLIRLKARVSAHA